MRTPGFRPTISVVVGTVGALATALVNILNPGESGESGENPEDNVSYVLHLNKDLFEIKAGKSDTLQAKGYKVTPGKGYGEAGEMAIQLASASAPADLILSPTSGQGGLACTMTAPQSFTQDSATIICTGSAGGKSISHTITLKFLPALELTLTTPDGKTRLEPDKEGLWACASVAPKTPSPTFKPDIENPKITFKVESPNANWVEMVEVVYKDEWQWVYLTAKTPFVGAKLDPGNPVLVAEYQEGQVKLSAKMTLELQVEYQLRARLFEAKTPDITYNPSSDEWQAPALLVYFINPNEGDTPVDPGFKYGFPDPAVKADPQAITIQSYEEIAPHQHLFRFKVDQDLAQYFGEELTKKEGIVKLTVEAIDEDQRKHTAEIEYTLRPEAVPMFYYWKDTPETRQEGVREVSGLSLAPHELLTDGKDEIGIGAFLTRSDLAEDFAKAYEHPLGLAQPPKTTLSGSQSARYLLEAKEDADNPHRYAGQLKAKEVIFYQGQESSLEAQTRLALDTRRYPNYRVNKPSEQKIKLKPIEIYLKLWVLPGLQVGTSDAGAFLYAPAKKAPLKSIDLTMDILSSGAALTPDQAVKQTDGRGLARWTLAYSGLTWNNYANTSFTIRCGLPTSEGRYQGTQVRIDIGQNINKLLGDLQDQKGNLRLENPEFQTGTGFFATLGDYCFPDFLSGPVNNIFSVVSGKYTDYVCHELRTRIHNWMMNRRFAFDAFDEKMLLSMNGIEIGQYSMWLLGPINHNLAGIFLSSKGANATYDPRFLDPWWVQSWSNPNRRYVMGLYTKNAQYVMQAGVFAALALLFKAVCALVIFKLGVMALPDLLPKIKYILGGAGVNAALNAVRGVYLNDPTLSDAGSYLTVSDGIRKGLSVTMSKPIPPVEPWVSW